MAVLTSASFLIGCFCSALAGYIGVWSSVRVNIRVAIAAANRNYLQCFLLCFRGGALSACLSASMCILGICALYLFCHIIFVDIAGMSVHEVPVLLAGYGFGASFVALFMQLGGGIYTKAADVGADMCGKIEVNLPKTILATQRSSRTWSGTTSAITALGQWQTCLRASPQRLSAR